MIVRNRILLLASLLLLVSVGGIVNLMSQMPRIEQIQDPKAILQVLIFLGLFGAGMAFAILELVRQEIRSPIAQLTAQVAGMKERKIDGQRLEFAGSKDIDLLTRALNNLLDGYEKEENLSRIFTEASPDMIFLLDQEGCVLFGNANAARQWNYRAEEIIGKQQEELFPPDIAARHKQVIKKIFETGQPVTADLQEMIGERLRWTDARMLPVLAKDGLVTAVMDISRDITERKRAEEALRDSEAQLRDITFSMADWEWEMDEKGVYTHSSLKGLELLGDVIGKTPFDFMPPDEAKKTAAIFSEIAQNKAPIKDLEHWVIRKNGERICLLTNGVPILDKAGNLKGYRGVDKDITERKRSEAALRESENRYRGVFAGTPDGIIVHDADGLILDANEAMAQRLEIPREALLERHIAGLVTPDNAANIANNVRIALTGQSHVFETTYVSASGKPIPAEVHECRIQWREGQAVLSISRDITGRKRAEEDLRASEARYRSYVDATDQIAWVTSADGEIVEDMPSFRKFSGQTYEEVKGSGWAKTLHPDDLERTLQVWNKAVATKSNYEIEYRMRRHDGVYRHLLARGFPVFGEDGSIREWVGTCIDITEFKRVEERIRKLNHVYAMLSNINQAIVRVREPQALFEEACRIAVEDGGFRMAWIGLADPTSGRVLPAARAGVTDACLKKLDIVLEDDARGHGPTGSAARASKHMVCNDIDNDPRMTLWREDALRNGYHSSATFPLKVLGEVRGAFGLYAADPGFFDDDEIKLLDELAMDIGFAMEFAEREVERKRAEEEREKMLLRQQGITQLQESLLVSAPLMDKLRTVTDSIVRLFDADFCRIWLIQPGDLCERGCIHAEVNEGPHICRYRNRCLHLLASSGRYTHTDGKTHRRVPFGCYKIGRVAAGEDHRFLTNAVQNDPRVHNHEWACNLGLVSFAGYQLRIPGGETLGVMALFAKHPILPAEDIALDGLGSTVALVVRQALAEEALRASEGQLSNALQMARAGHWEYDVGSDTFTFNDNFYRIFRTTAEKVGGYKISSSDYARRFCHPDDAPIVGKEVQAAIEATDPNFSRQIEHRILYADGQVGNITVRFFIVKDSQGHTVKTYGVNQDVTERKRAEEALKQQAAKLRARNEELTRFNRASMGRELRMIELKQELNELCRRLGEPPRYAVDLPQGGRVPSATPDPAPPGGGG